MRYAVYYAPAADSALHAFGSAWLGRDSLSNEPVAQPTVAGLSTERLRAITAAPRGYGFHATLKPPFTLASACDDDELRVRFESFAQAHAPFDVPGLRLSDIDGFLALALPSPSPAFDELAEGAVRTFEPFRAAPAADELARRLHARLSARERELVEAWGYPYVLDRWRFHLTLTNRLGDAERAVVRAALEPLVAPYADAPLRVDAVALFVQPLRDAPFVQRERFTLAARSRREVDACRQR